MKFDDQNNNPIIISESDIQAFENSESPPYERRQNSPIKQQQAVLVEAKCADTQQLYYLEFRQDAKRTWYFKNAYKQNVIPDSKAVGIKIEKNMIRGNINWGNIFCPYCSSTSIIKCAKCGRLTSHNNPTVGSPFTCSWCGNSGKIGGYIKSLGGSRYKK